MTRKQLHRIWQKTKGHCHFCGDPLILGRRGHRRQRADGCWEVDHVIQRKKGGAVAPENCLPACTRCNRLRWHRGGGQLRELLVLGSIAKSEIEKQTIVGKGLVKKAPRSLLLGETHRSNRTDLIRFLRQNFRRSFTAAELQRHTEVPKKWVRRLLETSYKVRVIPHNGRYVFKGGPPKKKRS